MKGLKVTLAWALTVILGSIIYPFIFMAFDSFNKEFLPRDTEVLPLVMLISIVISALSSLPTLIALLIVQSINARKHTRAYLKAVNITHIIMFFLTLLVGNLWIYAANDNEASGIITPLYSGIVVVYAATGALIWGLLYRKAWLQAGKVSPEENEEILDNIQES